MTAERMSACEVCGAPNDQHGGMNGACPSKHTPGPWVWSDKGARIVSTQTGAVIAKLVFDAPESVANAHLLAASLDMYAALKAVISVADRKTVEFDMAHAAIAKADGRMSGDLSGFSFVVTCECGAQTGFMEAGEHYFGCRYCGRLNHGVHGSTPDDAAEGKQPHRLPAEGEAGWLRR